jgi:hypothetical protein
MCEVDVALFVVDPSFMRWLLGTLPLFLLAFVVACVGLAFVVCLC